jgi:hypothetical protein
MGFLSSLSLLTPLYIAAGLAVTLPIVFHLIRRTPRGRQVFSSVMFLSPSPPRITKRSRIEHWLLLLLRSLAVILIVAAFCRPLWREPLAAEQPTAGQETIVLLDTSASLRRDGLWDEAVAQVKSIVDDAEARDRLTVLLFDERVRPLLDPTAEIDPSQRTSLVAAQLAETKPGWNGTDLGRALLDAADRLEQSGVERSASFRRRIVVVSDLQEGSRWESLQGFEWPAGIEVDFRRVGVDAKPSNAGLQVVGRPEIAEKPFVRVRVSNSANAGKESFRVGWRGQFDDPAKPGPATGVVDVYVPPGQSRVVRLEQPAGEFAPGRIVLDGDEHAFDNIAYVAWPRRQEDTVVYLGPDAADARGEMRFFLGPLYAESPERKVTIVEEFPEVEASDREAGTRLDPDGGTDTAGTDWRPTSSSEGPSLAIVTGAPTAEQQERLRGFLKEGGTVLLVLRDAATGALAYDLAGAPPVEVAEAPVTQYAMLRDVDFRHPLFAALDDPRFSDLSKVHFWRHRTLKVDTIPGMQALASYDDGDVALAEVAVGEWNPLVLTSGWNREDSELATWSKFVPIMNALLTYGRRSSDESAQLTVGQPLPLVSAADATQPATSIQSPGGKPLEVAAEGVPAEEPGLYVVQYGDAADGARTTVAVNLAADESRTAPLGLDVLESLGVRVAGGDEQRASEAERREQLARRELESRQKLWRWLLIAALVVLFVETIVAYRQSRLAQVS